MSALHSPDHKLFEGEAYLLNCFVSSYSTQLSKHYVHNREKINLSLMNEGMIEEHLK